MSTTIITADYRNQIGKKLTHRIGDAIDNGELVVDNVPDCCDAILAVIDTITSYDQLLNFLNKLSTRWPFFASVLETEKSHSSTVTVIESTFHKRSHKTP